MPRRYWLMKTEPESYSISDLARDGRTCWDGVRNYQARNYMRDAMKVGDLVLVYHSNTEPTGIAGLARVAGAAYPDHTALDPKSAYFDPKATSENPTWMMVDIEFMEKFASPVTLEMLRNEKGLAEMRVLQRGQRLSVMPVDHKHFKLIQQMAQGMSP